jgi:hypothetical protein
MRLRTVLGTASVIVAATASCASAFAQDSVMDRPADIRDGSCASVGEVVAPLAPLVIPDGETVGQEGADPVAQSVTEVPLLLPDILNSNSAIAVHASPDQVGTLIACGEIGGALTADDSLSVGLQAMNGAKISGVASFAPTWAGDGTLVTVLLVDERSGRARPDAVGDGSEAGVDDGEAGVDGTSESVDGAEAADGSHAADGVGNREVGPAPERAREAESADATDPTDAPGEPPSSSVRPGDDGATDRPGHDRDHDGGDGSRGGKERDPGTARAGEDGSAQ